MRLVLLSRWARTRWACTRDISCIFLSCYAPCVAKQVGAHSLSLYTGHIMHIPQFAMRLVLLSRWARTRWACTRNISCIFLSCYAPCVAKQMGAHSLSMYTGHIMHIPSVAMRLVLLSRWARTHWACTRDISCIFLSCYAPCVAKQVGAHSLSMYTEHIMHIPQLLCALCC